MNEIMMFEIFFTYFSIPILKQVDGIILNIGHTITRPEKNCWPNSGEGHADCYNYTDYCFTNKWSK